jgi:cation diffusion facilitator CzcD-associated flavoprotein CzcO
MQSNNGTHCDVLIVGAGFAGLYMLHRARGLGLSAVVLEAGDGVGGTWYWNRYPGARCDVESLQYSYQFSQELQQEWRWTEKYATQAEILRYIEYVAERFDLRRSIRFGVQVSAAHFDAASARWQVQTMPGNRLTARFLILAVGCLSSANRPAIPNFDEFKGESYHTGHWPQSPVDFTGRSVAVIGTGSSGIQCIPKIAEQARQLTVLQRTPNYAIPAWNEPVDEATDRANKKDYGALRVQAKTRPTGYWFPYDERSALAVPAAERREQYERFWRLGGLKFMGAFSDLFLDARANETAAEFVRAKIRAKITDAEVAERVVPRGVIGSKRLCVESNYYETFNRPNVKVVDIRRAAIERFTRQGLIAGGVEHRFDAVVFATGFDAVTGSILRIDITGRDGRALRADWRVRPRAFLGLATYGFPNLFMINGPGSPSVLSNMVQSIEQHVDWIGDCLEYMRSNNHRTFEPTPQAQDAWVAHCQEVVDRSVRAAQDSWYLGSNITGKPRAFLPYAGGFPTYAGKCYEIALAGYREFTFTS